MMKMDARSDSIPRFISRMFDAPGLRSLSALQKEEQALQFLRQNRAQLQPLLASLGIASAGGWQQTVSGFVQEIRSLADDLLEREIHQAVEERLELSNNQQRATKVRAEIAAICRRNANHPVCRRALAGSISVVLSDLPDKYVSQFWERRKYSYVELTRVQRLNLKPEECADLLRLCLLIRPAAYLHIMADQQLGPEAGFAPVQEQALHRALPGISSQLPSTPQGIVRMAVRSALPFPASQGLEAMSRLVAIFALRGRFLTPAMVVDRGADSPDKSWFNVTRRNAAWRGLDPRMLDELYSIAADNGW